MIEKKFVFFIYKEILFFLLICSIYFFCWSFTILLDIITVTGELRVSGEQEGDIKNEKKIL